MATITGSLQANVRAGRKEYVEMISPSRARAGVISRLQARHRALRTTPCDGSKDSVSSFVGTAGILVADGDPTTRHQIVSYLREQDMTTVAASGRQDLMNRLIAKQPALVILDLLICKNSGLDVLREIRSRSGVSVITMGYPCDKIDPVMGLELGADDHLPKPFGLRELLARIRAILRRRSAGQCTPEPYPKLGRCRFGGWQLDRCTRRLISPHGNRVALTKREYALLLAFLCAPQRPLSRESLVQATNVHEDVLDRSVDVQVLRLRRKLETDTGTPCVITTERSVGYVFTLPVEELDHGVPRRVNPDRVDRQT
jgi:DNA-binding response OmpR family regulator